jgi:hypothetical protein
MPEFYKTTSGELIGLSQVERVTFSRISTGTGMRATFLLASGETIVSQVTQDDIRRLTGVAARLEAAE